MPPRRHAGHQVGFLGLVLRVGLESLFFARLGSCGCLTDLPVGSLVLPKASLAVTRNLDFDFANGDHWRIPYRLSKPVRWTNFGYEGSPI